MAKIRLTCTFLFCLFAGLAFGQTGENAYGSKGDVWVGPVSDGPAELPRVLLNTSLANTPAPGKTISVAAGGNLQAAINNASCGDTVSLQAGAQFGSVSLPAKSCDDLHWVIIRTSAPDTSLPPEGGRLTPCFAGVASLPGRPAYSCPSPGNVLAKLVGGTNGAIRLANGANHYRLIGLEVTRPVSTIYGGFLMFAPQPATANHIIIDRSWFHGDAQDDTNAGFNTDGVSWGAVVDSYFSDFHCTAVTGACTDAKAIGGGTSGSQDGPFRIVDNFLEAAGENILFGGGYAKFTPVDMEITHNHFFKPLTWMKGQPGFVGGRSGNPFVVKNLFELKNGQRVLFEYNLLEDSWGGFSQVGYAFLMTPKNQAGPHGSNQCPLCKVTDITIRYSVTHHSGAGMSLANVLSDNGGAATDGGRYSIHDVVLDDVNSGKFSGSGTLIQTLTNWPSNGLHDVQINHITGFSDKHVETVGEYVGIPMPNIVITNSIMDAGQYPVWSTGYPTNCQTDDIPVDMFNSCMNPHRWDFNAVIAPGRGYPPSKWPSGNFFPANVAAVGFVNYAGGNYALQPSSPYHNAGSDGTDLGADIAAINAGLQNVN